MTDEKIDLALAFLKSKPESAASILEKQPIESVVNFISSIPHTYAAPVIERMLPQYIARLCKALDPTISAAFLSKMDISLVATILRHCEAKVNQQILDRLSEKTKLACKLLLNYSEDAVGAWMKANIVTLPNDCTVEDALIRLSKEEKIIDADSIRVVNRDRLLQGVVSIATLLKVKPDSHITSVMNKKTNAISGRTALISAVNHEAWAKRDTIPVINRNQQLVGVIRHVDLRRGLDHIAMTINEPRGNDPITGIYEAYGNSLLALFGTAGELISVKKAG
ncbi:CBS domain-containing protein [Rickettsiales bacterium]|nr:CBS domain-containing protein [Rickettsiales bacterium]